jgi:predicted aldo/keto reductase-like oxidoreductase
VHHSGDIIKRKAEEVSDFNMEYNILGKTNQRVSRLGFGAMNLPGQDLEDSRKALNYAVDHGINYIDTAPAYKDSEEIIGECISNRRHEIFLASKTKQRSKQEAKEEIESSLKRMKTDYIDLIQLHYVNYPQEFKQLVSPEGALEAAIEAKQEGKVRFIGITGHRPELLAKWLRTGHFDTVLFHMSLVQPFANADLLPTCQELNIGMIGMKPLSGGFVYPVEKALRYSYSTDVNVVLSGMTTVDQVKSNLTFLEQKIELEEKQTLSKLATELGEHNCRRCNYCSCPIGIRIPDVMISNRAFQKLGLLEKGQQFYEQQIPKFMECADYEPCREKPLCEQQCPYDLPIKERIVTMSQKMPELI